MEILYASAGIALLFAVVAIGWMLSNANRKHKVVAERQRKLALGIDPDAPKLDP